MLNADLAASINLFAADELLIAWGKLGGGLPVVPAVGLRGGRCALGSSRSGHPIAMVAAFTCLKNSASFLLMRSLFAFGSNAFWRLRPRYFAIPSVLRHHKKTQ